MASPLSFRWDEDFIAEIDEARGKTPRSAFVRRAVENQLAGRISIDSLPLRPPRRMQIVGETPEFARTIGITPLDERHRTDGNGLLATTGIKPIDLQGFVPSSAEAKQGVKPIEARPVTKAKPRR